METNKENNDNINTSNIFDDFTVDENLKEEVQKVTQQQEKDIFFYIKKIKTYIQILIIGIFLVIFLSYFYILIQHNENLKDYSLLDPICFVILGDINNTNMYCSSISSLKKQYTEELEEKKLNYLSQENSILENIYKLKNFMTSKEVIFLENKTNTKLDVIGILNSFDTLLNEFEPTEKDRIKCYNIEISNNNILKVTCDFYDAGYGNEIKGFDGTIDNYVGGSSISYVNSFINYIKTQSTVFSIYKEQKVFNSEFLILENGFMNKTKFDLELKYDSENALFFN